jgi:DNA-binding MarR family transcriptional regulator
MGAHISDHGSTRVVLDALRRIVQLLRESSRQAEAQLGVSGAQLFVLSRLAESPAQSLNELAGTTRTHQSSVSTVVTRLVERGLVARYHSAQDARRLELTATPRGRRLVKDAPRTAQDRLVRTIDALPTSSKRQLARLLTAVVNGLEDVPRPPRMFFDDEKKRAHRRYA